jgi:hypothetical protein
MLSPSIATHRAWPAVRAFFRYIRVAARRRHAAFCLAASVALLAGGCATSSGGIGISVGNAGGTPIRDVSVHWGDQALLHVPRMARHGASQRIRIDNPPDNRAPTVRWMDEDGRVFERVATLDSPPTADFKGTYYIEIGADSSVKVFAVAAQDGPGAEIPWAQPESWEGYPGIPGLTRD